MSEPVFTHKQMRHIMDMLAMSEIPKDVERAVERALEAVDIYGVGDEGGSEIYEYMVGECIAVAILAERERCAKIADGEGGKSEDDLGEAYDRGYREAAAYIASTIRKGEP